MAFPGTPLLQRVEVTGHGALSAVLLCRPRVHVLIRVVAAAGIWKDVYKVCPLPSDFQLVLPKMIKMVKFSVDFEFSTNFEFRAFYQ